MTAGKIDVQPSKPRTAGKQRHRANVQLEDDSIGGFYRVSVRDKLSFMCSTSLNTKHSELYSIMLFMFPSFLHHFVFSPHIASYETKSSVRQKP